jgi:hypothetical protein
MQVLAIDFESGFEEAFQDGIALLPKIGYFLLILIIGLFLAKFVQKILTKVLQKVGFDQMVERGGVKKALSKSKYDAAEILAKIVYYFIFLLVLSAAFGVFGSDNPVSRFLSEIVAFLPSLFVAVLALVIAAAIAAAVKDLLSNMLGGLSFGTAVANAASLFILALGVFFALGELGIAPLIVGGIFYALLALIFIPPIIAFGVGGIDPARETIRDMQSKGKVKANEVKREARSSGNDVDDEEGMPPTAPVRRPRTTTTTGAPAAPSRRRRPTA